MKTISLSPLALDLIYNWNDKLNYDDPRKIPTDDYGHASWNPQDMYEIINLEPLPQCIKDKETARTLGISISHAVFYRRMSDSKQEKQKDIFNNQHLGPNYEAVLNFWWFIDSLTENQWSIINERYKTWLLQSGDECLMNRWYHVYCFVYAGRNCAWTAPCEAYSHIYSSFAIGGATDELLEQKKNLTFSSLFKNL